jgi:hypothetical protein
MVSFCLFKLLKLLICFFVCKWCYVIVMFFHIILPTSLTSLFVFVFVGQHNYHSHHFVFLVAFMVMEASSISMLPILF